MLAGRLDYGVVLKGSSFDRCALHSAACVLPLLLHAMHAPAHKHQLARRGPLFVGLPGGRLRAASRCGGECCIKSCAGLTVSALTITGKRRFLRSCLRSRSSSGGSSSPWRGRLTAWRILCTAHGANRLASKMRKTTARSAPLACLCSAVSAWTDGTRDGTETPCRNQSSARESYENALDE